MGKEHIKFQLRLGIGAWSFGMNQRLLDSCCWHHYSLPMNILTFKTLQLLHTFFLHAHYIPVAKLNQRCFLNIRKTHVLTVSIVICPTSQSTRCCYDVCGISGASVHSTHVLKKIPTWWLPLSWFMQHHSRKVCIYNNLPFLSFT